MLQRAARTDGKGIPLAAAGTRFVMAAGTPGGPRLPSVARKACARARSLRRPSRFEPRHCYGDDRMVGSGGLAGGFGSAPRIARLATTPAARCTTATSSNTKTATWCAPS
jgi:hypothetical protein